MSREFEITREVDLPAAPDDVWVAITRDAAAWQFPTGMEIPAGGSPPEGGPVATWDPPHRLVIRVESPDGTFNALDYAIEARDGGTAHLRYVHSGILPTGGRTSTTPSAATRTSTSTRSPSTSSTSTAARSPTSASRRPASTGPRPPARPTRWTRCAPPSASRRAGASATRQRVARRRRGARRRHRLLDAGVPRRPHRRRPVPLLRAEPLQGRRRDERAPVRRRRRPGAREAELKTWLDGVYT